MFCTAPRASPSTMQYQQQRVPHPDQICQSNHSHITIPNNYLPQTFKDANANRQFTSIATPSEIREALTGPKVGLHCNIRPQHTKINIYDGTSCPRTNMNPGMNKTSQLRRLANLADSAAVRATNRSDRPKLTLSNIFFETDF